MLLGIGEKEDEALVGTGTSVLDDTFKLVNDVEIDCSDQKHTLASTATHLKRMDHTLHAVDVI